VHLPLHFTNPEYPNSQKFPSSLEDIFMRFDIYMTLLLSTLLVVACKPPNPTIPERDREHYEKALAGEKIECEHGINPNGGCFAEGDTGVPAGEAGCYPFCNIKK